MLSPFVGRKAELAQLGERIAAARAGRGGLALLVGPAGIGKSRTVEEAIARADLPAGRVLRGRSAEQQGAPAFWPWRRALRTLLAKLDEAALRDTLGLDAAALVGLIPELRARLPEVSLAGAADPQEGRFALLDGVSSWLLRAAADEPLVVFLDDLQWADASSLELLAVLAPELASSQACVLGTWREPAPRASAAFLPRLRRLGAVIEIAGLDPGETAALVEQRASAPPSAEWITWLHGTTGGNPFFVDEIVRAWIARGGRDASDAADAAAPPESVREVVRSRMAPLADEVREWLAIAAVLGTEFDLALLAAAAERDADAILEALAPAFELGLVEEAAGSVQRFRFAHTLIAETLYGDLSPRERAALHRKVGTAIEASRDRLAVPVAELAYHFFRAAPLGEARRAIDYAERAGHEAATQHAHAEAAGHFQTALDALPWLPPDEAKRASLLLEIGGAQSSAGAEAPAREAFESAARLAVAQGDAPSLARAALGYARVNLEIGVVNPTAVQLLEQAQQSLDEQESGLRVAVLGQLAAALYFSEQRERRDALSLAAVELARQLGDAQALATALLMRQFICWGPDSEPSELLALADEALPLAEQIRDRRIVVQLQRWRVLHLIEAGAIAEAEAEVERMVRFCDAWRLPSYRLHARLMRGALELLTGRVREAAAAPDYDGRFGGPLSNLAQTHEIHRFLVRLHDGGLEASEPMLRLASRLPLGTWRAALALLLVETSRPDEARDELDALFARGIEKLPRDGNYLGALALAAEAAYRLGHREAAASLLPLLAPHARRHVAFGVGAGGGGSLARYVGLAAATTEDWTEAVTQLGDAVASNDRAGVRGFAAYARHELACALRARGEAGDAERAAACVAQAREAAERLGIARLARRIDAEPDAPKLAARAVAPGVAEVAVLRREAESWRVGLGARAFHLRDTKGLGYLAALLREPGREWHALDLAGGSGSGNAAPVASAREIAEAGLATDAGLGDAGAWLDPQARADYQARLAELEDEQAEAERFNDSARAARAREEIEFLAQELAHGVGLGGRERRAGSAAERARLNVSRALAAVLRRIAAADAALGEHLAATVRTGIFCSYTPDPRRPLEWDVEA